MDVIFLARINRLTMKFEMGYLFGAATEYTWDATSAHGETIFFAGCIVKGSLDFGYFEHPNPPFMRDCRAMLGSGRIGFPKAMPKQG